MRAKLLRRRAGETPQAIEIEFATIPVTIEWPKGSTRTGVGKDGKPWSRVMHADYGYVPDTVAVGDNEDLDVYVGTNAEGPDAYVVEQLKDDGSFDEHKVMLGFGSEAEARSMYLRHYPEGWGSGHVGDIYTIPVSRLAEMVEAVEAAREGRALEAADADRR